MDDIHTPLPMGSNTPTAIFSGRQVEKAEGTFGLTVRARTGFRRTALTLKPPVKP
jgi:hypothetical protein